MVKSRLRTVDVVILAVLVIGTLVLVGWFLTRSGARAISTTSDPDAQAFMDKNIPAIFAHWDVNALGRLGDPAVYDSARMQRARQNFTSLSQRLGPFVSYSGAHGKTDILSTSYGQVKHSSYDAELVYRNGALDVHVDADKANGRWVVHDASMQPVTSRR